MKKLVLTTMLAAVALSATAANARTNLNVGIGIGEPAYIAPAPVYAAPVYEPAPAYYGPPVVYPSYYNGRDRHRNYDWRYWHDRDHGHWRR
jgi:hypothetical protein